MTIAKLHPQHPTFSPISPSHALYNFSQEHRITSAHMEKLDYFFGSRNQPSPCLNLKNPLVTRRFTENTSQSLLEQSRSNGNHVIFCWERRICKMAAGNWQCELTSWLGFLCLRFRFARQVQHYQYVSQSSRDGTCLRASICPSKANTSLWDAFMPTSAWCILGSL